MTTRRRRPGIVLAASALAVVLGAGGCTSTASPGAATAAATVTAAQTAWSQACPVIERPPLQVGSHLIGDADPVIDYSSSPPTSGWHSNAVPQAGRVHDELGDAEIVAALEAGLVVVATAPGVDTGGLDDLVAQFPDRLLATTYTPDMPTDVALLTWGTVARCDEVSATDVTTFVLTERVVPEGH